MKKTASLMVIAFCLFFTGQAYATAIYYAATDLQVEFSFPWQGDYAFSSSDNKTGTGEHFEEFGGTKFLVNNYYVGIEPELLEIWIDMQVYADGHAGDATGTLNGTSEASNQYEYDLNFGLPYAFNLTMDLVYNIANVSAGGGLPGESSSATAYNDIHLNGASIINSFVSNSYTLTIPAAATAEDMTRITLITHASGWASAIYDSNGSVIPEPTSLLLLGTGLGALGLVAYRRRKK